MRTFIGAWARGVVRFRAIVLLLSALLLAVCPFSFKNLHHNDAIESYFLEGDKNLTAYNRFIELFGDNEYLLLGVPARPKDRDVFTPATIRAIDEVTQFLENHRHVTQVRSLSKYQYTHDDNGILATEDLFEDPQNLAEAPEQLDIARNIMQKEKLALGVLLTPDLKHTLIAARTPYKPGINEHKVEITTELREFLEQGGYKDQGFELHMSGVPVIGERFQTLTQQDMAWINPTMSVIMTAILFLIFRSLLATLLPFLLIGCVVLSTTGIQGLLNWPFTAVNSALIPTIIILSIGTSIHVLVEFFRLRRSGLTPPDASAATVQDLLIPVFFTCFTTALGFIALAVTDLLPVRQFAYLAALSAALIFLFSMVSFPALLAYIPWMAKGNTIENAPNTNLLTRFLQFLPHFTQKHCRVIAAMGLVISALGIYSVRHITADTNVVNYFKQDSWVNRDLVYLNENFKGISNLEFTVDSGENGGIKDPDFLRRVDALQTWIESLEETGKALSIINFYKQINQSLHQNNEVYFELPTTSEMAAQFLLLYENTGPEEDLTDLKDFDERYLRLSVPFINMSARETTATIQEIRKHLDENFSDLSLVVTGALVMNNAQNEYINNGMLQSFGIAILVIGGTLLLLFRSLKYGPITLIPSIVPILVTGGIISAAGITMDLGTMIIGAMTIGIAVDDAIHLMVRYLENRKKGYSVYEAVANAYLISGKAVILTSVILITGFSVMLFGSFISYIYVGLFSALIMTLALVGGLLFLPALIFLTERDQTETVPENFSKAPHGTPQNAA